MSLKEAIALISLSSLFVGNDSGPMHIAAALGRPLVAIFGPSEVTAWRPWTNSPHRVVRPAGNRRAIELVPTGQVIEAIEALELSGSYVDAESS
jgi:ADP-heptose:LPS heptosyltransferase